MLILTALKDMKQSTAISPAPYLLKIGTCGAACTTGICFISTITP